MTNVIQAVLQPNESNEANFVKVQPIYWPKGVNIGNELLLSVTSAVGI